MYIPMYIHCHTSILEHTCLHIILQPRVRGSGFIHAPIYIYCIWKFTKVNNVSELLSTNKSQHEAVKNLDL
jgi:hypothetical protein